MNDKIMEWFAHGEVGISSKTMACAIAGMKVPPRGPWGNHPSDPDDLKRCIRFLEAVPEARQHMDKVAALSKVWAKLVANWEELEHLFNLEFPSSTAPKLYARMKALGC